MAASFSGLSRLNGRLHKRAWVKWPDAEAFTRPPSLEPQINFWVNVFTTYSYRDFLIVDRDDPYKIYQVYHLAGDGCPSRDEIEWVNNYLKNKYGDILMRLD